MLMKTITGANVMYVSDIENLSNEQCKQLKCGDKVIWNASENEQVLYEVNYANENELSLVASDSSQAVVVAYVKTDEGWVYDGTNTTYLGGVKLYLHSIRSNDENATYETYIHFVSPSNVAITSVNDFLSLYNEGKVLGLSVKETLDTDMPYFYPVVEFYKNGQTCLNLENNQGDFGVLDEHYINDTVSVL